MKILVSSGTSDKPETAYLNALAGVISQMNEGLESRIFKTIEQTPNGFVVHIRVEVVEEGDLDLKEETGKGGDGKSTNAKGRKGYNDNDDEFFDAAALYSASMIEKERQQMLDASYKELAHSPADDLAEQLPQEFEQVAEESGAPNAYEVAAAVAPVADKIVTEMHHVEMAAATIEELSVPEDVKLTERPADNQNKTPAFEKKANPLPPDELNLVA